MGLITLKPSGWPLRKFKDPISLSTAQKTQLGMPEGITSSHLKFPLMMNTLKTTSRKHSSTLRNM